MIGQILGNYRIVSTIGEGGMGVVYRAEHVLIGRRVAIKLLQPRLSNDAELVERFFNEARAAAMLQHPGLVEVFDFGSADDGRAYIVMELLEGESLTMRLRREQRLAIENAVAIARQVASALHAAHEQGIVHRDLKPENIFLVTDPESPGQLRAKVLDFGIAKLARVEEQRSVKTRTGAVFGTPRYMSPEQCKNATNVDRRTDIYALGCILYEMVLGVAPFDYESWGELVAAHIHETPPRPRTLDPALPAELDSMLVRALAKQPAERFATMAELAQAIDATWRIAASGPYQTMPTPAMRITPLSIMPPAAQVAPTLPVAAEVSVLPPPRLPGRWIAIAIATTATAAITVAVVLAARDEPASAVAAVQPVTPPAAPVPSRAPADAGAIAPARDAAAPATHVHLVIDSIPGGADIYRTLDGVRLGKTPLARDFERTDGEVELVLRLAGYRDAKVTLSTASDATSETRLVRVASAPHPRPPPSGSAGATVLDPYGGP